jgi:hypothetical protein
VAESLLCVYFVNCTILQLPNASMLNFLGGNIRQSKMRHKIESVRRIHLFGIKLFKLRDCDFLIFYIL